jgi:hypothetical protein
MYQGLANIRNRSFYTLTLDLPGMPTIAGGLQPRLLRVQGLHICHVSIEHKCPRFHPKKMRETALSAQVSKQALISSDTIALSQILTHRCWSLKRYSDGLASRTLS